MQKIHNFIEVMRIVWLNVYNLLQRKTKYNTKEKNQ